MRLGNVSSAEGKPQATLIVGGQGYSVGQPGTIITPRTIAEVIAIDAKALVATGNATPTEQLSWAPPLLETTSFRDFYAFERHVKTARARRGLEMIPQWYDAPVFYFSNPASLIGHDQPLVAPTYGYWLDFELEVGCIIGRAGRDIPVESADEHIAGYCVINDWSLRDVQRQEMAVGLGPAKGKDFATSVGPWLVTPDELEDRKTAKGYRLEMVARRNGRELSRGVWSDLHFSFAEMIARASQGVWLRPGDLIGSGTVGSGCILELGAENVGGWLGPGDTIELEIERLGVLRNTIVADDSNKE